MAYRFCSIAAPPRAKASPPRNSYSAIGAAWTTVPLSNSLGGGSGGWWTSVKADLRHTRDQTKIQGAKAGLWLLFFGILVKLSKKCVFFHLVMESFGHVLQRSRGLQIGLFIGVCRRIKRIVWTLKVLSGFIFCMFLPCSKETEETNCECDLKALLWKVFINIGSLVCWYPLTIHCPRKDAKRLYLENVEQMYKNM